MTSVNTETHSSDVVYQVITSVAEANDLDPLQLEPRLNEIVDPDALARLFSDRPNGAPRQGGRISFEMAGCQVTIRGDRSVEARLQD